MKNSKSPSSEIINTLQNTDRLNIVPKCIDTLLQAKKSSPLQINELITEITSWAKTTNKHLLYHQITFFRAEFIIELYYNHPTETRELSKTLKEQYSLQMLEEELNKLILYFKRKDNKRFLIKAYLHLSKINLVQNRLSQARSYLTAARATASVGFIPKELQYKLDYFSGIVYLAVQEVNMASNYFFECVDAMPNIDNVKFYIISQIINLNFVEVKKTMNKYSSIVNENMSVFERYAKLSNSIIENDLRKFSECFYNDLMNYKDDTFETLLVINTVKSLFDSVLDRNILKEVNFYNKIRLIDLEHLVGVKVDVILGRLEHFIINKNFDGTLKKVNNQLVLVNHRNKADNYCENVVKEGKCLIEYLEEIIKKNNRYFHYENAKPFLK